jgi:TRAP-type C4-dicarboxylate transport system substrate-binding protein
MSTLHISDTLLDGYVVLFQQLTPTDQAILLDKLMEPTKNDWSAKRTFEELQHTQMSNQCISIERAADSSGIEAARQVFGAWGSEENREDVDQMILAIAENRTWDPEVEI